MRLSILARRKALAARIAACIDQLRPEVTRDAKRWREISMLFLDLSIATNLVMERRLRDMISKWPRAALEPLRLRAEDLDLCETAVCKLEQSLNIIPSTSTTARRK